MKRDPKMDCVTDTMFCELTNWQMAIWTEEYPYTATYAMVILI